MLHNSMILVCFIYFSSSIPWITVIVSVLTDCQYSVCIVIVPLRCSPLSFGSNLIYNMPVSIHPVLLLYFLLYDTSSQLFLSESARQRSCSSRSHLILICCSVGHLSSVLLYPANVKSCFAATSGMSF